MLSLPTRDVLLWLGRSATESAVKASGLTEPSLSDGVQAVYERMAETADWPEQVANHLLNKTSKQPVDPERYLKPPLDA